MMRQKTPPVCEGHRMKKEERKKPDSSVLHGSWVGAGIAEDGGHMPKVLESS